MGRRTRGSHTLQPPGGQSGAGTPPVALPPWPLANQQPARAPPAQCHQGVAPLDAGQRADWFRFVWFAWWSHWGPELPLSSLNGSLTPSPAFFPSLLLSSSSPYDPRPGHSFTYPSVPPACFFFFFFYFYILFCPSLWRVLVVRSFRSVSSTKKPPFGLRDYYSNFCIAEQSSTFSIVSSTIRYHQFDQRVREPESVNELLRQQLPSAIR